MLYQTQTIVRRARRDSCRRRPARAATDPVTLAGGVTAHPVGPAVTALGRRLGRRHRRGDRRGYPSRLDGCKTQSHDRVSGHKDCYVTGHKGLLRHMSQGVVTSQVTRGCYVTGHTGLLRHRSQGMTAHDMVVSIAGPNVRKTRFHMKTKQAQRK